MRDQVLTRMSDGTQVGEARRRARSLAARVGMDEQGISRVGIIVTEIATNLVGHATEGLLLLQAYSPDPTSGPRPLLDIFGIDRGPGMQDVGRSLRDGYSTSDTPGTGLGAVSRLSDEFDIHSAPGQGTVLFSRVYSGGPHEGEQGRRRAAAVDEETFRWGAISVPHPDEQACGDQWGISTTDHGVRLAVMDGLGHGIQAADASRAALEIFYESVSKTLLQVMEDCHAALKSTRGAAMAIAEIEPGERQLKFIGVGNIAGTIYGPAGSRSMISHNGIVGDQVRKMQEFAYDWSPSTIFVMHSDGIGTQWRLERYGRPEALHPALSAGLLFRDYRRARDDSTVVAIRVGADYVPRGA